MKTIIFLCSIWSFLVLFGDSLETISNDIFDTPNVDTENVASCPPFMIPCFDQCCPPIGMYCNSQRHACEPYVSNRLINVILIGSSSKGPSYSVEKPMLQKTPTANSESTDALNDASDTSCLDIETQCSGGCCPYSNATCCAETCCRQGAVCLGPLNTCLSIKTDEKNSATPVLYTEKAVKLRQVNGCPPFTTECYGVCCPQILGFYCDHDAHRCVPLEDNSLERNYQSSRYTLF